MSQAQSWITLCGEPAPLISADLEARVQARLQSKEFRQDELDYVRTATYLPIAGDLQVTENELNVLRRLCQSWDIELRPLTITSHRPIIGPVIVAVKKILFPLVQVFLKDLIRQQRDFNSSAIALMGALVSERKRN